MEIFKTIILGIVEGITEWLPVSSTGHLILVNEWVNLDASQEFINTFNVVIQLGAIIAVIVFFFNKLNPLDPHKTAVERTKTWNIWMKVIIAVIPSAVIGLLFDDMIEAKFFNPITVASMLIIYGIIMIILENGNHKPKVNDFEQLSIPRAIGVGLFQCLALIPGTSRSAATIIGGVYLGTSRYIATEFSFFLAIPTMFGASALKLVKNGMAFSGFEWMILGIGSLVSFIVSMVAIKFLMDYIKKHDFKVFGYYRIVLGIAVLLYFLVFSQ
ncbi:MAG TPA: undecaprenyl-diphosphatase [Firmicutes bacterium]|nr:undecaprenyl-diphosphatase [Bacillota bacterium]